MQDQGHITSCRHAGRVTELNRPVMLGKSLVYLHIVPSGLYCYRYTYVELLFCTIRLQRVVYHVIMSNDVNLELHGAFRTPHTNTAQLVCCFDKETMAIQQYCFVCSTMSTFTQERLSNTNGTLKVSQNGFQYFSVLHIL